MTIKRLVVFCVALTLAAVGSVSVAKDSKKQKKKSATSTFFETMQIGDDVTLATSGPLELFAKCTDSGGGKTRVNLLLTSSKDGWRSSVNPGARDAGVFESICGVNSDQETFSDCSGNGFPAAVMSANGRFLGLLGGATGVGVNVFGADCVVAGGVLKVKL